MKSKIEMKRFRNIIPFVLCFTAICFFLPLCATAQKKGTTNDGLKYAINDNAVTITGINGKDTHVVIPETINGVPVKIIRYSAFQFKKHIQSIVLPSSLTTIGPGAFYNCPITSFEISSDVETKGGISPYNFYDFYEKQGRKAGKYIYQDGAWYSDGNIPPKKAGFSQGIVIVDNMTIPDDRPSTIVEKGFPVAFSSDGKTYTIEKCKITHSDDAISVEIFGEGVGKSWINEKEELVVLCSYLAKGSQYRLGVVGVGQASIIYTMIAIRNKLPYPETLVFNPMNKGKIDKGINVRIK